MKIVILQGPYSKVRAFEMIRMLYGPGYKPGRILTADMNSLTYAVVPEDEVVEDD